MSRHLGRSHSRLAVAVCALALLAACDPISAPLMRYQAAFRPLDDGGLRIWSVQDCPGVREVRLEIEEADDRPEDSWVLRSTREAGTTFTGLTLGEVPDGFEVSPEWPADPAWSEAKTVKIRVKTAAGGQTSSYVSVDAMLAEADDHGEDEYYVEDVGWLTQDEFRALVADDERIAPLCGPGTYAD